MHQGVLNGSPPSSGTPRVAYVMSRFPKITETFILFEIIELERRGIQVDIFPLLRERASVVHPEAQRLMPRVHFQPFMSLRIAAANLRFLGLRPRRYLATLFEVLWGTRRSLNFFVGALGIFPKSVRMAREMEDLGIEHVHAHFASHPALSALIIHRLTGIPFSFTAHGSDIHIDQTMFGPKLAAADFAVTVCRYNVDFLAERCGAWVRDRLGVLHCGTDPDVFRPLDDDTTGDPKKPFTILCVAALREVKGHRYLIEACRLLQGRGVDVVCRLVGEGPLAGDLSKRISDAGLEGRVTLEGALPRAEVARAMQDADVVTLPSILGSRGDREGVPVVLMEAMAVGRPVVSSRQAGIPELVKDGVCGLLCPPGDAEALASALEVLARDPDLRRRMGAAGRAIVQRDFNQRINAAKLADMLASKARLGVAASDGVRHPFGVPSGEPTR